MRIWNFLIIYSCWSDAGKKALNDENDTAVGEDLEERNSVFLKDNLPKAEFKKIEKEEKKRQMKEKLKVIDQIGLNLTDDRKSGLRGSSQPRPRKFYRTIGDGDLLSYKNVQNVDIQTYYGGLCGGLCSINCTTDLSILECW